ncbi:MAG: IS21 family transposase [Pseudomonadota bacterium]
MEQQVEVDVVAVAGPRAGRSDAPVKVAAPEVGAEEPVVGKERWEEMRRLHAAGMKVAQIARVADLDRKTVRRCLRQTEWRPYQRAAAKRTLLSAHSAWLAERAPAVNYSARILYQELRATRGYTGGYDTVRNAVRPLRLKAAAASLTQCRFETEPGEQAQADWGQVRVRFDSGPAEIHIFVLTLGYSRRGWAEGYEHERMESLLAAHENGFAHFGGVPREILYDRMRTVIQGEASGAKRWNPTFKAFAAHWGFEPRVCRPYRAQTKGKVESGVKYVKGNFLPGRTFRDLADFNAQLRAWLAEIADCRIHGTTHEAPIVRFAREATALTPLAGRAGFLQAMRRERVVAGDWLVTIDTNRYSVPWRLIGQTVTVVRVGAHWQISHRGQVVAEHPVLPGRYQLSVKPEHGPGAAARNARKRYSEGAANEPNAAAAEHTGGVEVRDLAVYEQTLEVA